MISCLQSRPRYIQRSKSHDDPHGDIHAPAGTARGRIARQGARIVRSRSPSSSPVRKPKSPTGSPAQSPVDKEGKSVGPAEVAVNMTYANIPGAGSPPQSAQSVKESKSQFRFSLRKRDKKRPESPGSQEKISNISGRNSPESFSPPGYDRPKPLLTSPIKKPSSPLSLVKSRINQFAMKDSSEALKDVPAKSSFSDAVRTLPPGTIKPLPPPPIPPRIFRPKVLLSDSQDEPSPTGIIRSEPVDRQVPSNSITSSSQLSDQKHMNVPSSNQTTQSNLIKNPFSRVTNPFLSSPESPVEDASQSGRKDDSKSTTQTYVSSRCSSDESLTEATSLLKDDEKTRSRSSVCIYFDGSEIPDTLV